MVLITKNDPLAVGSRLPAFRLSDTLDAEITDELVYARRPRGLVVAFTCNHCPYVMSYERRFLDLARITLPRGISWLAVNSNAANPNYGDDSVEKMKSRVRANNYPFPYAPDLLQDVARSFGAACTPEFFLFDEERRLRYTGRLDDDQDESRVKTRYLAEAIEDLLAARVIRRDRSHPIGCSIKWL